MGASASLANDRMVTVTSTADGTREVMLDAAEILFADQGIDATTVSEIHRLSGQLNKSAVHYHFGSREGLLLEVISRHQRRLQDERLELLSAVTGRDLPGLVAAIVRPSAGNLGTETGRRYLRIIAQVVHRCPSRVLARPTGGAVGRTMDRIADCLDHLDPDVRTVRLAAAIILSSEVMAARARQIDVHDGEPSLDEDDFIAQVEAMVLGVLTHPVDPKGET